MPTEALIAFNLALLAALLSPGPAMLYAMRTAMAQGRAAGVKAGCGLALAAAFWTGAALAGLNGVFALFPWAYGALKLVGAAYLLWIAHATWRSAGAPAEAASGPSRRPLVTGALVNLSNPKSVLFAAAVLVVIFPPDLSIAQKAVIVANHLLVELAAYGALAVAMGSAPARAGYMKAKRVLDRIAAGAMGALGLRLLAER